MENCLFKKINKIKAVSFSERLSTIVDSYNKRPFDQLMVSHLLDEVAEKLIELMGDLTYEKDSFEELGINYEEKAFYDVLIAVEEKYGFENVSQICSISYIKLKSGIKDVCRALNISIDIANKISQDVPWEDYENLDQAILKDEKARQYVEKYPELFKYVRYKES